MSLINKMLQELDARRSDASGVGQYGQQIRAVPERRRIHPAWWVALALGISLSGVLSWIVLQPPVVSTAGVQLPLKLDTGLTSTEPAAQPAAPQLAVRTGSDVSVTSSQATPVTSQSHNEVLSTPSAPADTSIAQKQSTTEVKTQGPSMKPPPPARTPSELPLIPRPADLAPTKVPVTKSDDAAAPAVLTKQIKELTSQQRAENEYRKALQAIQVGKFSEAIAGLQQALQLDAQHVAARQALVAVLLEAKRTEEAQQIAQQGLVINAEQPGLAMILARLQLEKGEQRAAIDTLERTLPYAVERADYQAFLAALLQREGKHKQAVEHYLLALQKTPQSGVWWMGLGISLEAESRTAEARDAFKRAKATNTLSAELTAFVDGRLNQLRR